MQLLRSYRIALVIAETAGLWPQAHDVTADFVYVRLHGDKELYRSGYSKKALSRWAKRIAAWHRGGEPADAMKIVPERKPAPRNGAMSTASSTIRMRSCGRRSMHRA